MSIGFVNLGTVSNGTTSVTPGIPVSLVAGNLLFLVVINKYPNNAPTTPSGWTLVGQSSAGTTVDAVDSGHVYCTVWYKISDGTESGTVTVTVTSGNATKGLILQYSLTVGDGWGISPVSVGSFTGATTAWSATGDIDPGLIAGDRLVVFSGINTDNYTFTAESVTASGVTFGTNAERNDTGTSSGDDCGMLITDHAVTAGPSSGVPTFVATASGSVAATAPAGPSLFVRIRDVPPISGSGATTFAGTAALGGAGALAGSGSTTFGGTAALIGAGALVGSGAVAFDGTGTVQGAGALVGSGSVVSDGTAALTGSGALVGSGTVSLGGTASLGGAGSLAGTGSFALDGTADLLGLEIDTGTGAISFDGTAALLGAGALVGIGSASFAGSAALLALAAISGTGSITLGGYASMGVSGGPGRMGLSMSLDL